MKDTSDPSRNDHNDADRDGNEQADDEQALDEVVDALPGSGRLKKPDDDDLDAAKGPIQVP